MIRELKEIERYRNFIDEISRDPDLADPMLANQEEIELNLLRAPEKPNDHVLGVFDEDGRMTGLFVFLIIEEEKYIEMIVGLSREAAVYEEALDWLQERCPGFQADFVFNPRNGLLKELLHRKGAFFDTEQMKMLFTGNCPEVDTAGIVPLSGEYREQYIALHGKDVYWTGEKVVERPDRFNVFLALEDGKVVGYIDVTNCYEENEPYDLWVSEAYRRRGFGRKLLAKALEENRPKDMMLLMEVDNEAAISLYQSMGFTEAVGKGSQTVNWMIPKAYVPVDGQEVRSDVP